MRPKRDGMAVLAQQIGQRRAPGPRTDNGYFHVLFLMNRFSVPLKRRRTFALCL